MALSAPPNERKRVKVYELRENDWYDRGTGFCNTQCILEKGRIFVESEENPDDTLLENRIKKEDSYQKQQDTLIVWTDNNGIDMALSFQEADGCGLVCDAIGTVQQRPMEDAEDMPPGPLSLPPPSLANLPVIDDVMRRVNLSPPNRDSMSKMIVAENYISKLTPLVEEAEDLESLADLHRLCSIMKTLILFNDTQIIEYVVRDDMIQGVVGALEYDPDFPFHKANHRQYLSDESKFKEVVPLQDPDIKRKIHFTYRLQYLKDVVLARILDDPTFSVLNSLIFFNQVEIVQHIQSNIPYLNKIFSLINSANAPAQDRKDAVLLIQQSCAIAKNLQAPTRASLYENLINEGLFSTITFALQHKDAAVRVAGTDILVALIDHSAVMTRQHVIKAISDKTKPMTETLIELLLVETDLGVKAQIADALKVLLDPSANGPGDDRPMGQENSFMKLRNSPATNAQTDSFLNHFYEHSANKLFQPLKDLEKRTTLSDLTIQDTTTFVHLIEILCFFMRQHNTRGRLYILNEGFHRRVSQLLQSSPEKHLKLSAIKYFRTVVSIGDEYHTRQLMQFQLFKPILDVITTTMPRDNLLNSACLELFAFIRREDIKWLIIHLAESYRDTLESITDVEVFTDIILRYEQHMNPPPEGMTGDGTVDSSFMTSDAETPNTRHITINGGGRWQGLKDTDPDEDAYFNTSDDEDDEDELAADHPHSAVGSLPMPSQVARSQMTNGLAASPLAKPLVDYEDDDDGINDTRSSPSSRLSSSENVLPSSTTSPHSAERNADLSPSLASAPPPMKRSREDDDEDDELSKLSSGAKRRSSSTNLKAKASERLAAQHAEARKHNATSPSPDNSSEWEMVDGSEDKSEQKSPIDRSTERAGKTESRPTLRQSARRKEKDTPNGKSMSDSDTGRPRKISISLGNRNKEG